MLNVESSRFLLALSSLVFFIGVASGVVVVVIVVASVVVGGVVSGVVATGGSLCCYTSTNQQSQEHRRWEDENKWGYDISWNRLGFKVLSLIFFVSLSLTCIETQEEPRKLLNLPEYSKKKEKFFCTPLLQII